MYGLVLEGGGAKGAYQIGAYRALAEMGIEIGGVAGTSIGALNGAMIVQGDYQTLYDLWHNISPSRVFDVDEKHLKSLKNYDFNQDNILYLLKRARRILNNRGLDISRIKNLLENNINEQKIRNSEMDFGIVTVNLSEMESMELYLEDIPEGKLIKYLIASAYFPAFKLEKMDGSFFIDGGFYDNLPIRMLIERGFKEIIAVRTYGMGRVRKVEQEDVTITYIAPESKKLGRILDFSREKIHKNIKLGYYDTLKQFRGLSGNKYYISADYDEKYYFDYLLEIGREKILTIGEIFDLNYSSYRRMLFEAIIPRLIRLLELDKECCGYKDIVIALLEKAAGMVELDRYNIYDIEEMTDKLVNKYKTQEPEFDDNIPDFIKHNDFLSRAVKDKILNEILIAIFANKKSQADPNMN
ncbi:MAG: patatin-like phospholipase family protein [Halothermotrichaceae bacterium]